MIRAGSYGWGLWLSLQLIQTTFVQAKAILKCRTMFTLIHYILAIHATSYAGNFFNSKRKIHSQSSDIEFGMENSNQKGNMEQNIFLSTKLELYWSPTSAPHSFLHYTGLEHTVFVDMSLLLKTRSFFPFSPRSYLDVKQHAHSMLSYSMVYCFLKVPHCFKTYVEGPHPMFK